MSTQIDLIVIERRGKVSRTQIYSIGYGMHTPTPGYVRATIERRASLRGQYPPVTVTAATGNSSLLFFSFLKNTVLPQVRIEFYRPNPRGDGTTEQYYTIILTDAIITSKGRRLVPVLFSERVQEAEQIEIGYQNIEWAYVTSPPGCWSSQD